MIYNHHNNTDIGNVCHFSLRPLAHIWHRVSWSISRILLSFVLQFNLGSAKCNCVHSHGFSLENILFICFLESTWKHSRSHIALVMQTVKWYKPKQRETGSGLALVWMKSWAIFLKTVIVECSRLDWECSSLSCLPSTDSRFNVKAENFQHLIASLNRA